MLSCAWRLIPRHGLCFQQQFHFPHDFHIFWLILAWRSNVNSRDEREVQRNEEKSKPEISANSLERDWTSGAKKNEMKKRWIPQERRTGIMITSSILCPARLLPSWLNRLIPWNQMTTLPWNQLAFHSQEDILVMKEKESLNKVSFFYSLISFLISKCLFSL